MLVLSATWRNDHMRKLIDSERFKRLLRRTIRFLCKLAPISPTCKLDCSILEKIERILFGIPSDERPIYDDEKGLTNTTAPQKATGPVAKQ